MGSGAARAGQPDDCVHRSGSIHSMILSYATMDLYGNGPGEQRILAASILCTERSMRLSPIFHSLFRHGPIGCRQRARRSWKRRGGWKHTRFSRHIALEESRFP